MDPSTLLAAALGSFALAAISALFPAPSARRALLASTGMVLGALLSGASGVAVLRGAPGSTIALPSAMPGVLGFSVRVDPLAGFALVTLALVALPVALGVPSYLGRARAASSRATLAGLSLLFLSIALVAVARHAVLLLLVWESMSLAGYLLVVARDDEAARKAGATYFVLAHVTSALLTLAFGALYAQTGTFEFDAYRHLAPTPLASAALVAATLGLAAKAGIIPFHGWLPPAYRAAPAPASAAMSGVMSKMAAFLLLRITLEFLAPGPAWWGYLILALGAVSVLGGILYALQQDDLKLILAYSSIENLGIVFVATGLGVVLLHERLVALAALAFAAAILHILNHAAMKSLLFLASGNVETQTGTLALDRLGGLARRMRWTSAFFLVGAIAMSALPPLNGFVSEWLLYQSLVGAFHEAPAAGLATIALSTIGVLALAGGLAVATFVKAQAITFHAAPRSREAAQAEESSRGALVPLAMLAAACLALALAAPALLGAAQAAVADAAGARSLPAMTTGSRLVVLPNATSYAPAIVLLIVVVLALALFVATRVKRTGPTPARGRVWASGRRNADARETYTGLAMAKPIRMMFSTMLLPDRALVHPPAPGAERAPIRFHNHITLVAERYVYEPVAHATVLLAQRLRIIQKGSVRVYIGYILIVLVLLVGYVSVVP